MRNLEKQVVLPPMIDKNVSLLFFLLKVLWQWLKIVSSDGNIKTYIGG